MASANLEVKLTLNDRLRAGFRKATTEVKRFGDRTRRTLARVNKSVFSLRGAIGGLGAALTIAGITRLIKSVADTADQIGKLSARLGVSTELLGTLSFAAEQTGTDFNNVQKAIQKATQGIGEFARTGAGEAAKAFEALGLGDAIRDGAEFEELLPKIADALSKVRSQAQRVDLSARIFGLRGGPAFLNLLQEGSEGLAEFNDEAEKLNLLFSRDETRQAEEFNDEINRLKKTLLGFANEALIPLLPKITAFAEGLKLAFTAIRDFFSSVASSIAIAISNVDSEISKLNQRLKRFNLEQIQDVGAGPRPTGPTGDPPTGPGFFQMDADGNLVFVPTGRGGGPPSPTRPPPTTPPPIPPGQGGGGPGGPSPVQEFSDTQEELTTNTLAANEALEAQRRKAELLNSGVKGVAAGVGDLQERFSDFSIARQAVNDLANSLEQNLNENINALIDGTKSAKEAFSDFARSMLADLQRIIVRALIAKAIGALVGPVPTGGGVASFQSGGFVPPGRTQRAVLHGGRSGEFIIPADRLASTAGVGGGGTVINNFITAMDVESFDQRINGSISRQGASVAGVVANEARNNQALRTSFGSI